MRLLLNHLSENRKSLNKNLVQKLFITAIERNNLEMINKLNNCYGQQLKEVLHLLSITIVHKM